MASYQTAQQSDSHPTRQQGVLQSNKVEATGQVTIAQLHCNAMRIASRNRSSSLFKGSKS
jgi:hypothetical protein